MRGPPFAQALADTLRAAMRPSAAFSFHTSGQRTMSSGDPHIQAALDAAQKRIRDAAAAAMDPATSALKSVARTASPLERPALTLALTELVQGRQPILAAFEKALREAVEEDIAPKDEDPAFRDPTDWKAVGLVDEDQFEDRLAFERVGQFISHECEAELRDLTAYICEMLDVGWADPSRNPLRGNVIGAALSQAIEAAIPSGESRRIVIKELGQALAKTLPSSYRGIIEDFSARGIRQVELVVRASPSPVGGGGGGGMGGAGGGGSGANAAAAPGFEAMRDLWEKSMMGRMPAGATADVARAWEASTRSLQGGRFEGSGSGGGAGAGMDNPAALLERLMQEALSGAAWNGAGMPPGGGMPGGGMPGGGMPGGGMPGYGGGGYGGGYSGGGTGASDADLMRLLRRLSGPGPAEMGEAVRAAPRPTRGPAAAFAAPSAYDHADTAHSMLGGLMATNLIRAHHDELVQASPGQLDHMVIEVVASLFDQILADSRVQPQIAREIARLQMPVLRVALRDTTFFSSRKHPVRRFINRISTLATSFGELDSGPGKELLGRVNALVTEIVEGDFDQVPLYARKLGELEQFVAEKAKAEFERTPAAATLQAKEAEWEMAQRFSGLMQEAYEHLPVPEYIKEFLSGVWSQVIVAAARGDDADPAREKRYRRAAYHLVASIQPKRTIEQRNEFLAGLRGLTTTLDEGLALIGWPKEAHDAFFGKLIADHSGSLKAAPGSELDHNMLMRQLDAAARTPLPDVDAAAAPAPASPAFEPHFSPKEAARLGLIDEAAVDWSRPALVPAANPSTVVVPPPEQGAGVELDLDLATRPAALDELPAAHVATEAKVAPIDAADAFPTIEMPIEVPVEAAPPAAAVAPTAPAEPEEPTEGPQLRHHLQIGVSYRLQLKDQWEKVRLTHMNASRTFFLFTHGAEDRGTISMTARMLGRLCETHRLKAFEDKPLIDRATERVRMQAGMPPATPTPSRRQELSTA
jgi:hypothetical protein